MATAFLWAITTAAGWLLAWQLGLLSTFFVYAFLVPFISATEGSALAHSTSVAIGLISGLCGGLAGGTVGGLGQWLWFPRRMTRAASWIPATVLCYAAVLAAAWATSWPNPYEGGGTQILAGATAGAIASIGQLMILRKSARKAGMWIPTSAVAWGLGLASTQLTAQSPIVGELASGSFTALVSLVALLALFRVSKPAESAS